MSLKIQIIQLYVLLNDKTRFINLKQTSSHLEKKDKNYQIGFRWVTDLQMKGEGKTKSGTQSTLEI